MSRRLRLLMVEDSEDDALLVVREIQRGGHAIAVQRVQTRSELEAALRGDPWDLMITDNQMPEFSADEAIRLVSEAGLDLPVLVVSGTMSEEHAVDAMRAGARDYIVKGNIRRLVVAVERELREAESRRAKREAEAALREASGLRKLVLSQLPLLLYTSVNGRRRWVSENVELVTGFPRAIQPETDAAWAERSHAEDRERVLGLSARARAGLPTSCEYRWQRADGQWRWLLETAVAAPGGGAGGGLHGSILDVSDRKRLEEEFRQAQKMEALGQLAAGVAHDFNNLLAVIQGYAELLGGVTHVDARAGAFVTGILEAARRSALLTQQLLAFSRRQVLQPRALRLNDAVGEAAKLIERLVTKGVRLVTTLEPDLGVIMADVGSLQQLLLNLAANARDAMQGSGELRIETRNTRLGGLDEPLSVPRGDWVELRVADTGCGMDERVRARMFEPFFTTKEPGQGTGLGLATVKSIVDQCGGRIAVDTAPGVGTTFRIFLPRTEAQPTPPRAPVALAALRGQGEVLVVDDEEQVGRVTGRMLETLGYQVWVSRSRREALEVLRARTGRVQVLVADVVMPDVNGITLAAELVALQPGLRVVFLTGYPLGMGNEQRSPPPEAILLPKPFSREDLARKLQEALASGAPDT